ncbi:PAS domain S-box protein [Desulfococcaceae bacterium HSG9]|nr:PAS domain S-box protein [Desulfococcaceae bacterium HSG9]
MPQKPTYEELEQKIAELKNELQLYKAEQPASKDNERPGLGDVFLDLINVMDIAMWELDMNYRVVASNRKAKEIYGEESIGSFCYFAASGENAVCSDCPAKLVYDGHSNGSSEHCRTTTSGKTIYIDHIATPIRDKTGNLTGALVLIIDITERKLMEEEIRKHRDRLDELVRARTRELLESEQRYRALFENTNDAVFFISLDNIYLDVNQQAADMLGYDIEELIGKSVQNVVAPNEYDNACRRISALVAGLVLPIYERTFRKKDGTEFPAELNVAMIYDGHGKPKHIQSVVREITERKRAEEALRESEMKYRQVVENATEGIFVIQDNAYCYVNRRGAELFETTREKVLSWELYEFVHPDDRRTCADRVSLRKQGGTTDEILVHRIIDSSKNVKWVEARGVSIIWEGRKASMCFVIDITERKRAEEQIKVSLREKKVLLQEIHHRVKNNLAIVSSLLSFQSEITPNEQARAAFRESRNRIRAMARIHEHLYQSPDLAQIDMARYVRGVVTQLRRTYGAGTVAFQVEIADVILDIDSAMPCGLIINELASNAFKYAFPSEWHKLENEPKLVRVGMHSDDHGQCVLKVSDNGVGLPADLQIENVKRESLGLRLVNILCEQLEGTLQVSGEGGAVFCLTFPYS